MGQSGISTITKGLEIMKIAKTIGLCAVILVGAIVLFREATRTTGSEQFQQEIEKSRSK
jgi:hypothetical protein